MRRTVTLVAGGLLAAVILVAAVSAATQFKPPNAQALAQHLQKTQAPRFMTGSAQTALKIVASGDRGLSLGHAKLDVSKTKTASGGLSPPTPSFTNVRVNDPSTDSHQVDQTTQSETAIAASGSNVAVGYNDSQQALLFLTAGLNLSGYAYSRDGGSTFTDGGVRFPTRRP